jgi:membrane protease subunit HflC
MIAIRKKNHLLFGFLICLLFIIYQSATIVPEGHTGLLTAENLTSKAQTPHILKPGLHFKIPYFTQPILLDNRLQTLTFSESSSQDNPVMIDYYVNWHISDPAAYYQHTKNNLQQIKLLITQQMSALFHDKQSNLPLSEIILHGSTQLNSVITAANKQLQIAGIRIDDIGFKQLQLSADVNARLLDNMSTEQENRAIAQRAEGKINAQLIRAKADNSVNLILAQANEEAAQILAEGDAEAAKIYNKAYNKNPAFAAFYIDLLAYQKGFNQSSALNNFLVLSTDEMLKLENFHANKTKFKLKT